MENKLLFFLLQIVDTWSLRLHVETNKTSRFLGGSLLGVMTESPMFMHMRWFWLVLLCMVIIVSYVFVIICFKTYCWSSISLYPWYWPPDKICCLMWYWYTCLEGTIQLNIVGVKMKVHPMFSNNILQHWAQKAFLGIKIRHCKIKLFDPTRGRDYVTTDSDTFWVSRYTIVNSNC